MLRRNSYVKAERIAQFWWKFRVVSLFKKNSNIKWLALKTHTHTQIT